ncbi:MAG: 4-phosphoerythronate dehydrogenase [Planctomycetota bacterium]|jgi:erythronate-4-phosphate dehydrogenase
MKIIADENIPSAAECFSTIGEVELLPGREITSAKLVGCDILLVRSITKVNADLLSGSKIRFVGTATIGTDHIDQDYLQQHNIGFASAPGSNANSVAEYVIAALLAVANKHRIKLEGMSVGIIGAGNVGSRVGKKVKALGMKPYLNDPPLQRQTGDAKYLPIEKLFDCDIITLHTPLTFEGGDKTYHLADEKFFRSLKPGCIFINTARGAVTDTEAIKAAIKSGHIKATILDVWENEPDIDNELLRMVDISTQHIAGYSLDGKIAGMMMLYKSVCEYFDIEMTKKIEDFLPNPTVPEIEIAGVIRDEQKVIHETVQQVYAIGRDDFNTREILMVEPSKRGAFFDQLRKDHQVRREFGNTITFATENTEGAEERYKLESVVGKLIGLGFGKEEN